MGIMPRQKVNAAAIADKWTGEACTLNGQPAKITGRNLPWGFVAPLDTKLASVEFPWTTIERIMSRDRKFVS